MGKYLEHCLAHLSLKKYIPNIRKKNIMIYDHSLFAGVLVPEKGGKGQKNSECIGFHMSLTCLIKYLYSRRKRDSKSKFQTGIRF